MSLRSTLTNVWNRFQGELFPALAEEVGPLLENHRKLVRALDLAEVERFVSTRWGGPGRPQRSRQALARAFVAKAIWDLPTTRDLIDRLGVDATLRRLCGWPRVGAIPSEATFSRAFAEFSQARLAERMHEALVKEALGAELIGHVSRDSTAIEGREKPAPKPAAGKKPKRRRGRPRKGEEVEKEPGRLERQSNGMSLKEMLADLPRACDHGAKRNAKGLPDELDRLQAAPRHGRLRRAGERHPGLGIGPRQPGGDPPCDDECRTRDQPLRPHGRGL